MFPFSKQKNQDYLIKIKVAFYITWNFHVNSQHITKHFRKNIPTSIPIKISFLFSLDFVIKLGAQVSPITTKRH